jgi:hypothetical protein
MGWNEVNFSTATFSDIHTFTRNLLRELEPHGPGSGRDAQIAYLAKTADVLLAKKSAESLDRLSTAIANASTASSAAAEAADTQAKRMVTATRLLVGATAALFLGTVALAYYTHLLVLAETAK